MEVVIKGILWVLVISSATTVNVWLGFLGFVFGQYRSENPRPKFSSFYSTKLEEVKETWKSGDRSVAVAFAIFAVLGVGLGLLCAIDGAKNSPKPPK